MASVTVPGASSCEAHNRFDFREAMNCELRKIYNLEFFGQHGSPLVMPKRRDKDED